MYCVMFISVHLLVADFSWMIMVLSVIGKIFVTGAFDVIYLYTAEVYPTMFRAIGVGTGSMIARIGSLLSPFIVELVRRIREELH